MNFWLTSRHAGLGTMLLGPLLCLLSACGEAASPTVAQFGGELLTLAELRAHLPKDVAAPDSLILAEQFVNQWLREKALGKVLRDSFPDELRDIEYQVADYRRKLEAHRVLDRLVQLRVDTLISTTELRQMYEQRRHDAPATQAMIQVRHLKVPRTRIEPAAQGLRIAAVQQALTGPSGAWPGLIGDLAEQVDSTWVSPSQLSVYAAPSGVNLLANAGRQVLVYPDAVAPQTTLHFFYVSGMVAPGDPMPLALVEPLMRRLVLAQRRRTFLTQYEQQVVNPAYLRPSNP